MRSRMLIAASAAALLAAGPLAAQTAPAPTPRTDPAPPAATPPAATPPMTATPPVTDRGTPRSEVNAENNVHVTVEGGAGMRSSKLIGASVYNGTGDDARKIGDVDDIILGTDKNARTAILSVGGFLGVGSKLVSVPFDQLQIATNGRVVLPGATVDSLKAQPEFSYRAAQRS